MVVGKRRTFAKRTLERARNPKRTALRAKNYLRKLNASWQSKKAIRDIYGAATKTPDQIIETAKKHLKALRGKRALPFVSKKRREAIASQIDAVTTELQNARKKQNPSKVELEHWDAKVRYYSHLATPLFKSSPYGKGKWIITVHRETKITPKTELIHLKKKIRDDIALFRTKLERELKDNEKKWVTQMIEERRVILAQVEERLGLIERYKISSEKDWGSATKEVGELVEKIGELQKPTSDMTIEELQTQSDRHKKLIILFERMLLTEQDRGDRLAAESIFESIQHYTQSQLPLLDEIERKRIRRN